MKAMRKNTIDDYKKGVKAKYEEAKTEKFSGFLLKPSPAELKNLCLLLFDKDISKQDQEILDRFFGLDNKFNKRKQMEYFNVDKLRPISNFMKGNTETTRTVSLDLIAFLVDFNPRPYKKFFIGDKQELTDEVSIIDILKDKIVENGDKKEIAILEKFKNRSVLKKITLATISLFILGSVGYGVKNTFFLDQNCMVWVKNYYEVADCEALKYTAEVRPFNQNLLDNFKKIIVCDTTTFFKNGDIDKPVIWYGKAPDKKQYEYFNQPGLHPETGKTLKPISKYIIDKYIIKK